MAPKENRLEGDQGRGESTEDKPACRSLGRPKLRSRSHQLEDIFGERLAGLHELQNDRLLKDHHSPFYRGRSNYFFHRIAHAKQRLAWARGYAESRGHALKPSAE